MAKTKKSFPADDVIPGGSHPFFYHTLISNLTPASLQKKVILDVGCGRGIYGYLLRSSRDLKGTKLIGLDVNQDYLNHCKKFNVYDRLIKQTLPQIPLPGNSVDLLICSEVIEHLKKKQGEVLIKELERVCKGRIIITTPNLFFHTHQSGTEEDEHHSIWSVNDFKKRGYKIYGMGFKTELSPADPFLKIKQALYFFMTPFSYFFPEIGAYIIAVKDRKASSLPSDIK